MRRSATPHPFPSLRMLLAIAALLGGPAVATTTDDMDQELSLADLMNLKVESVSKRAEPMMWAPSAIYVLTADDLRTHGVRRFQDAFRMVPGFFLAEKDWNNSYYNIRDQKTAKPTTVNILVDGIPQQDAVQGAVALRDLEIPFDLIDRIEFIRGPGGTVYGANSVTGIISIYTKKPTGSPAWGTRAGSSWPGNHDGDVWGSFALGKVKVLTWAGAGRYAGFDPEEKYLGDSLSVFVPSKTGKNVMGQTVTWNDTTYRVKNLYPDETYGTTDRWNAGLTAQWGEGLARWTARVRGNGSSSKTYRYRIGGYRTEAEATRLALLALRFNADSLLAIYGTKGVIAALPPSMIGAFSGMKAAMAAAPDEVMSEDIHATLLTANLRSDLSFSENHTAYLNAYGTYRDIRDVTYGRNHNTYEIEAQDVLRKDLGVADLQLEWITGANLRMVQFQLGEYAAGARERYLEPEAVEKLYAGFGQGKLSWKQTMDLIAGLKGEVWTLIGDDVQWSPSAKIAVHPSETWNLWGSVSRSVTVPGYTQTRAELPVYQLPPSWALPPSVKLANAGYWRTVVQSNPAPASYLAWEGGARGILTDWLSADVTGYYTGFEDRVGQSKEGPSVVASRANPGDSLVPLYYQNMDNGGFWGIEGLLKLRPVKSTTVELGYTWSQIEVYESKDPTRVGRSKANPEHQIKGRLESSLPLGIKAGTAATWFSSYKTELRGYDYVKQVTSDAVDPSGTARTTTRFEKVQPRVRWDLDAEIPLWRKNVSLQVWAHDVLAWSDHPLEEFGYVGLMKPQGVSADIGGALRAEF